MQRGVVAGKPLVAGLPTDAVPLAELRSSVEATPVIADETFTLVHGCVLLPGHRPTSEGGW
jgi:hypothetical protein